MNKASWTPDRIIASVVVLGCLVLVALGIDSELKSLLAVGVGWLFRSAYMDRSTKKGGD